MYTYTHTHTHQMFLKINEIRFFGRLIVVLYLALYILTTMLQEVNILSFTLDPFDVSSWGRLNNRIMSATHMEHSCIRCKIF